MLDIKLVAAADFEMTEARDWYESESAGLGDRFITEVEYQLHRIAENPLQFPRVYKDVRRGRLRVFPYALIFREREGVIYVLACFHSSRNPRVWRRRI